MLGSIVALLALGLLKIAAPVFIALLLTVLMVYLVDPIPIFLERRGVAPWLAGLLAIVVFAILFFGLGTLVVIDLARFGRNFPSFAERLITAVEGAIQSIGAAVGLNVSRASLEQLRAFPVPSTLMSTARGAAGVLADVGLVFFLAAILLVGKHQIPARLAAVFPGRGNRVRSVLEEVDRHLRAFLGIKSFVSLCIGIGSAVILLAFRVEFAITWGFLALLLNFVPTIGPILAVTAPVLLSFVQFDTIVRPLAIAASLSALHAGIAGYLEPKLMGERLNLSFFVIFLSLLIWGWMWGAAGILLAVPVTASIRIVLDSIPRTRRLATLLGRSGRPPADS